MPEPGVTADLFRIKQILDHIRESDKLSPEDKRLAVLRAFVGNPTFQSMPSEMRRATIEQAKEYVGAPTGPLSGEHEPGLLSKIGKAAGSVAEAPSVALQAVVRKVNEIAPYDSLERAAQGFTYQAGSDVLGLANALTGNAIPGLEGKAQAAGEAAKDLGNATGRTLGKMYSLIPAFVAPEAEAAGGATAAAAALKDALKWGAMGGRSEALDALMKAGKGEAEPVTQELTNVAKGAAGAAVTGPILERGAGLISGFVKDVLNPKPGTMSSAQAAARWRSAIEKMKESPDGIRAMNKVRSMLGLEVVPGETPEQLGERIYAHVTGRPVKAAAPGVVQEAAPAVEGAKAAEQGAVDSVDAAMERIVKGAPERAGEGAAGTLEGPAAGEAKPPRPEKTDTPAINTRALVGDDPVAQRVLEEILDSDPSVMHEIQQIRAEPMPSDIDAMQQATKGVLDEDVWGPLREGVQLHDPEKIGYAARRVAAEARRAANDYLESTAQYSKLANTDADEEALRSLVDKSQEAAQRLKASAKVRALLGQFSGRALKGLDTATRTVDKPVAETIKEELAGLRDLKPSERLQALKIFSDLVKENPDDYTSVQAAADAAADAVRQGLPPLAKVRSLYKQYYNRYWYNNIFSGIGSTLLRNPLTNVILQVADDLEKATQGALSRGLKKGDQSAIDAIASISGWPAGIVRGARASYMVMAGKVPPDMYALTHAGSKIGEAGPILAQKGWDLFELPGLRALAAGDIGAGATAFEREMRSLAARHLRDQGITDAKEIIRRLPEAVQEIADNPELFDRVKSAVAKTEELTLRDEPPGLLGHVISFLSGDHWGLSFVRHALAPVLRVPARLMQWEIDRLPPVAVTRAIKAFRKAAAIPQDDARAAALKALNEDEGVRQLGKAITGGLMLASSYLLAKGGKLVGSLSTYSGSGSMTKERKAALAQGKIPYGLEIGGGKEVSLRGIAPFDFFANVGAALANSEKAIERGDVSRAVAEAYSAVRDTVADQPYFQGIQAGMKALDTGNFGPIARNLVAQHIPLSSLVRGVARANDPQLRETRYPDFSERIISDTKLMIPGIRNELPKRYDLWGRPMIAQGGAVSRTIGAQVTGEDQPDRITQLLSSLGWVPGDLKPGVTVTVANKTKRVSLSPEEMAIAAKWRRFAHDQLDQLYPTLKDMRPDLALKVAKHFYGRAMDAARAEMNVTVGTKDKAREKLLEQVIQSWEEGK